VNSALGLVAPQSVTLYWYVVRGSGFVVYLLLTAGVVAGLLLSVRWRSDRWPRLLTEDLHQFLQLLALVFLAIHVVSTLLDTFVRFEWYQLLIPFVGPYRTTWLGLGIIAMYFTIALALSIYVRRHIGYRVWRRFHYTGFGAWLFALVHSLATGTDTRTVWALAVYGIGVVAVVSLLAVRFAGVPLRRGQPSRRRAGVLTVLCLTVLLGVALTAAGPLQHGWAARAGLVPPTSTVVSTSIAPFRDTVSGLARPYRVYSLDPGYQILTLDMTGDGPYPVTMVYRLLVRTTRVGIRFVRGLFSMSPRSVAWSCSGIVAFQPPDRLTSSCRPSMTTTLRVVTAVRLDLMGRASGTIAVFPVASERRRPSPQSRSSIPR